MGIWQVLVDRSAFTGAYESVKRYVRKLRGGRTPEPCAVTINGRFRVDRRGFHG